MKLSINIDRLAGELRQLATFSDCPEPSPAVTRVVFTDADLKARAYLRSLYETAGLKVRVDAVGNTFARWEGQDLDLPVVATGSHTDAIPFSGMYDGTVGVLGGLEAIRSLRESGFSPKRSIELVMITSEEPTRFGIGCIGSRIMAGTLGPERIAKLSDEDGKSFDEIRMAAGFSGTIESCRLPKGTFHAWVELHIEQGPELEASGLPIGIVTAIAAPATMVVEIIGQGGHAGGVLMPRRRDALCAAAEMIASIEMLAITCDSPDLVATVGQLSVHPGAVNSIPSKVRFTIDLRDIHRSSRDQVKESIESMISDVSSRRSVETSVSTLHSDPPATCSTHVLSAATSACESAGLQHQTMISRAYHDSLFISQIAPMAMLFIPCRGGVSHRPDEYSTPEQIRDGVEVLARTLANLSSEGQSYD